MNFGLVSSRKYFFWTGVFLVLIFTVLELKFLDGLGFFQTFLFLSIQTGLILPLLIVTQENLQKIKLFNGLNPWIKTALAGIVASVIFSPFALFADYIFDLEVFAPLSSAGELAFLVLDETWAILPPVTLCWIAINAPRILQLNFSSEMTREHGHNADLPDAQDSAAKEGVLSLLPKHIGKDIIYMVSELHYLRVVTSRGEALVLYSLYNAINDLDGFIEGIQTHRSYWINKVHIDKIVGKAAQRQILTQQGYLVPVSRRQYKEVKALIETL